MPAIVVQGLIQHIEFVSEKILWTCPTCKSGKVTNPAKETSKEPVEGEEVGDEILDDTGWDPFNKTIPNFYQNIQ